MWQIMHLDTSYGYTSVIAMNQKSAQKAKQGA